MKSVLDLVLDGRPLRIRRIGPALHGWIFKCSATGDYFRVMPVAEAPLERREAIHEWNGDERPGAATIRGDWQVPDGLYVVRYAMAPGGCSLSEMLDDPTTTVRRRLEAAVGALRALPRWWEESYRQLIPMPSEIIIIAQSEAIILPLPPWRLPPVTALFDEPQRIRYLAPELLRGGRGLDPESVDLFALGAVLYGCFYRPAEDPEASELIARAATGELYDRPRTESALPYWYAKVPETAVVRTEIAKLLAADPSRRRLSDPQTLAGQLAEWQAAMQPGRVARDLRDRGASREAYSLLLDMLLIEETAELLTLAGEIASGPLQRPLEAIDLFERALLAEPSAVAASEGQFLAIARGLSIRSFRGLLEAGKLDVAIIDERIRRDYDRLGDDLRTKHEVDMARYLLSRERWRDAAEFSGQRLGLGSASHQWWNWELSFAHLEALVGISDLPPIEATVASIRKALREAHGRNHLDADSYQRYLTRLGDLESRAMRHATRGEPTQEADHGA